MNRRFRLSQAASADLDDIWVYVAQDGSEGAASRLIDPIALERVRRAGYWRAPARHLVPPSATSVDRPDGEKVTW
jgi:hypothetical protein